MDNGEEFIRYNISGNYNGMTGMYVADFYRTGNTWDFAAIGEGVSVRNLNQMI